MAPMRWVRYAARDGIAIPALLTVPAGANGRRVPLIVSIHGGPHVQATAWGYDPVTQFLASRGYAVLEPQFRGTEGFGWKLLSSGFRKWGDEMQDDLEDGVKWAVAEGIADAGRVCFYGGSYGGYAALWGAIRNAGVIRCAVAFAAVTSIDYMFDNAQTDMSRLADRTTLMAERIGDPGTERARFRRVSPLHNAERVGVPVLLAYGATDVRVPLVHGTDFRAALDKHGKEYEWVLYAEEGHGLNLDANVVDFYTRVDRFLAKHLGDGAPGSAAGPTTVAR
jgi:dipeptidyl aminopeptidase/acylaminoacyl peptidase